MKKIILSIVACLAAIASMHGQVSDVTLGYCGGELPASGTIRYSEPESWVSAAVYIPANTLNTYAGNQITGINAALASKLNVEELTVWVRKSLDGENLAEKTITKDTDPKIAKKWNEVTFDTPYDITSGEEGLYIGYSFFQKKLTYGIASLPYPTANGLFYKFGDGEWEDHSDEGTLCVEARVQGDNLPKVNLMLTNVRVPEVYIIDKGVMTIGGSVWNRATHTITGFDVNVAVDGKTVATSRIDMELPYNQTAEFETEVALGITEVGSGKGELTITVDNINEGADEDPTDNSLSAEFTIIQHDFKRRILVEEFTTEKCPNCPRVGNYIHDSLEKDEFKDDVIVVCHHSGYYTDWLTTSFDNQYLWLFNAGGSTYAPAITVDRDANGGSTSVFCPSSSGEMESSWKNALANPAFVSVNVEVESDAADENHITVRVNGAKSVETLCANPQITVFVVEDNIDATSQAGAANWVHQHVNRAVNSTWGDPVEFIGDDYSYECEFNLMPSWKRDDIQIVAFIANYNESNAIDCEVQNAGSCRLENTGTGISTVGTAEDAGVEIYTISGLKVSGESLAPGIYIRKAGSQTEKFVVR